MNYYCIVKYFHEKRQILKEQYIPKFTFAKNVHSQNIQDMYESVFSSETEFVSYKQAAFHLLDWSGVDYFDVFISCLDSHSDGTHSLQRIHLWASDVMLHFSKPVLMNKQTHLDLG